MPDTRGGIALAVIPVLLVGLLTSVQLSLFTALYTLVVLIALGRYGSSRGFSTADGIIPF
jgi:hypothetical protein